eukprot:gnl/TRDRNA2_/TRDRNA2_160054_c2_seq1.p1 gnl/TRDRNA2_/TRDRNA2_160054_c2~~gnl/TRDRNA2_/TRDRNA2_160054_c2_seq1.p1  ORF type:complete len:498 (+),score=50.38 gnl/TRDRNA2_/TRDRNA2_160054_c2_seq1:95-1495(+)
MSPQALREAMQASNSEYQAYITDAGAVANGSPHLHGEEDSSASLTLSMQLSEAQAEAAAVREQATEERMRYAVEVDGLRKEMDLLRAARAPDDAAGAIETLRRELEKAHRTIELQEERIETLLQRERLYEEERLITAGQASKAEAARADAEKALPKNSSDTPWTPRNRADERIAIGEAKVPVASVSRQRTPVRYTTPGYPAASAVSTSGAGWLTAAAAAAYPSLQAQPVLPVERLHSSYVWGAPVPAAVARSSSMPRAPAPASPTRHLVLDPMPRGVPAHQLTRTASPVGAASRPIVPATTGVSTVPVPRAAVNLSASRNRGTSTPLVYAGPGVGTPVLPTTPRSVSLHRATLSSASGAFSARGPATVVVSTNPSSVEMPAGHTFSTPSGLSHAAAAGFSSPRITAPTVLSQRSETAPLSARSQREGARRLKLPSRHLRMHRPSSRHRPQCRPRRTRHASRMRFTK